MKRIIIGIVFSLCSLCLYSQEILDNTAFYRAEYIYLYKKDSLKTTFFKDIFYLDICKSGHSYFYSRANQYKDSIKTALRLEGMSVNELSLKTASLSDGVSWYIDKRFVDGEFDYTNQIIDFKRYTAPLELPQWEIVGDTITINGFLCKEAHAVIGGRKWIAWFTEDVQINDGPWLLWGLPGLIIHAKDSNNYFKFNCTSVAKLDDPYTVLLPGNNSLIEEIPQKKMLEMEQLKAEDPLSFIRSTDDRIVKIITKGAISKQKYIPMIIADK